jgi:hypothetical protein
MKDISAAISPGPDKTYILTSSTSYTEAELISMRNELTKHIEVTQARIDEINKVLEAKP